MTGWEQVALIIAVIALVISIATLVSIALK